MQVYSSCGSARTKSVTHLRPILMNTSRCWLARLAKEVEVRSGQYSEHSEPSAISPEPATTSLGKLAIELLLTLSIFAQAHRELTQPARSLLELAVRSRITDFDVPTAFTCLESTASRSRELTRGQA
jgi:hypothetical protein